MNTLNNYLNPLSYVKTGAAIVATGKFLGNGTVSAFSATRTFLGREDVTGTIVLIAGAILAKKFYDQSQKIKKLEGSQPVATPVAEAKKPAAPAPVVAKKEEAKKPAPKTAAPVAPVVEAPISVVTPVEAKTSFGRKVLTVATYVLKGGLGIAGLALTGYGVRAGYRRLTK